MTIQNRSPTAVSDEGRHARDRGDPVAANPYPPGSDAHRTWERGYRMSDAEGPAAAPDAGGTDAAGTEP